MGLPSMFARICLFLTTSSPVGFGIKELLQWRKSLGTELRVEQVESSLIEKFQKQFGYNQLSEILTSLGSLDQEGKNV